MRRKRSWTSGAAALGAMALLAFAGCSEDPPPPPPNVADFGRPDFGPLDFGVRRDGGPRDAGSDAGGTRDAALEQGAPLDLDDYLVMATYDLRLTATTASDPPGVEAARARWAQVAASPGDFVVRLIGYELVAAGDTVNRDFYFDVCADDAGACLGAGDLLPNSNGESLVAVIESSMNAQAGLVIGTSLAGVSDILDVTRAMTFTGTFDVRNMPSAAGALGGANSVTLDGLSVAYRGSTTALSLPASTGDAFAAALVSSGASVELTADAANVPVPLSTLTAELWTRVAFNEALGVNGLAAFFTAYVDCDSATLLSTICEDLAAEIATSTPGAPSARLLAWQAAAGITDQTLSVGLPESTGCTPVFDGFELESFDCSSDASWVRTGTNQDADARFVVMTRP